MTRVCEMLVPQSSTWWSIPICKQMNQSIHASRKRSKLDELSIRDWRLLAPEEKIHQNSPTVTPIVTIFDDETPILIDKDKSFQGESREDLYIVCNLERLKGGIRKEQGWCDCVCVLLCHSALEACFSSGNEWTAPFEFWATRSLVLFYVTQVLIGSYVSDPSHATSQQSRILSVWTLSVY